MTQHGPPSLQVSTRPDGTLSPSTGRLNAGNVTKPLSVDDVAGFLEASRYWERPSDFGLSIENHRMGIQQFLGGPAAARQDHHQGWDRLFDPAIVPGGPALWAR